MVLLNSVHCVSSCATNKDRVTKRSNSGDPEKSNHLRHVHNALSVPFQVLYVQTNEIKVPEGLVVAAATWFLLLCSPPHSRFNRPFLFIEHIEERLPYYSVPSRPLINSRGFYTFGRLGITFGDANELLGE